MSVVLIKVEFVKMNLEAYSPRKTWWVTIFENFKYEKYWYSCRTDKCEAARNI